MRTAVSAILAVVWAIVAYAALHLDVITVLLTAAALFAVLEIVQRRRARRRTGG